MGDLALLRILYQHIIITPTVYAELLEVQTNFTHIQQAIDASWLEIKAPRSMIVPPLRFKLDAGELDSISLALELHADVLLIDERRGSAVAKDFSLHAVGLLGVLVDAKRKGLIPELKPRLKALQQLRFFISYPLYLRILQAVNESPD